MPNIKPVSDLKDYTAVLHDVSIGAPVFLTEDGRGRYAIIDIREQEEYERLKAEAWLKNELEKGRRSGEEEGWLSEEEVREHFRNKRYE